MSQINLDKNHQKARDLKSLNLTSLAFSQQFVCTDCGFNMVGFQPKRCRFCGAKPDRFLSAEDCSKLYRVTRTTVTESVTQLKSTPKLGYEHWAYQIDTGNAVIWIDCPASFDTSVAPMDYILFTHNDFLGASNLYRQQFGAKVWIHQRDAAHPNSRFFDFDRCFETGFELEGIEAVVVGGHSPGFTLYFFENVLFICDYVDFDGERLSWNAYGNRIKTPQVGKQIHQLLSDRIFSTSLELVCGVDYICKYDRWKSLLDDLVMRT